MAKKKLKLAKFLFNPNLLLLLLLLLHGHFKDINLKKGLGELGQWEKAKKKKKLEFLNMEKLFLIDGLPKVLLLD